MTAAAPAAAGPPPARPPSSLGLTWGPIAESDLDRWLELERAVEDADALSERFGRDDLRDELLAGSWKDPARDTLLGVDAGGAARAFGLVERRPGDTRTVRAFCWGAVHPQWRGRGVGRAVLAWQRARAGELLAGRGEVPGLVLVGARAGATDRERLLRRAGLAPLRRYSVMRRRLQPPAPPPPPPAAVPGLRLVGFEPALDERVRLAHNEAFAEHWGSEPRTAEDWATWTTGHRGFREGWSVVALAGEQVAGYLLAAGYEQDWAAQGFTECWVSLLGVRPPWRGRGVARALLATALRAAAADGIAAAGLDVDTGNTSGALALYTGLGFEPVEVSVLWAADA